MRKLWTAPLLILSLACASAAAAADLPPKPFLGVREANRNGTPPAEPQFNPKVVDAIAQWIKASLAEPPVAAAG